MAAAILVAVAHAHAAAGEPRSVERRPAVVPRASARGRPVGSAAFGARLALWIEGGVGAIIPIPAGGGGGLTLAYGLAKHADAGIFGHCIGASGGAGGAAGETSASAKSVGVLCDLGLAAAIHGAPRPIAPEVEIGLAWGFLALVDESRRAGRYSGSGPLVSARGGVRIAERYQAMLRADVPLFRAGLEGGADDTLYGWSLVGEFGFRLF